MQDQLASDVAESRAALDQSKKDATEALAAAELSSKQALRKADAHLDDWKERVAGVRHVRISCCLYFACYPLIVCMMLLAH